jgi:hypothetical protein
MYSVANPLPATLLLTIGLGLPGSYKGTQRVM